MEELFKMSALFLHDNFKVHVGSAVLHIGGMLIKNRLQIVYDSIVFYQKLFLFGGSHGEYFVSNAILYFNLFNINQFQIL